MAWVTDLRVEVRFSERREEVCAVVNGRTVVPRAASAPRGKNVFGMRATLP